MFRFLLIGCVLALLSTVAYAQDVLIKHNKEELQVKVVEVTPTHIHFRLTENLEGPLYIVRKAEVRMVRYANGSTEQYGPASASAPLQPAPAPTPAPPGPVVPGDESLNGEVVHLGGPRIGFTVLAGGVVDRAREELPGLNPFLTQFGWQFETRIFRLANGTAGLFEFVPLVGGLEQSKFIPSLNALIGIRGPKGLEFALGPNLTPVGTSVALAVGTSFRSNGVNFPVNLAVVPGNGGMRISLLAGFNSRRRY